MLIAVSSLMLIGSAGAKFAHVPKVVTELGAMGFGGNKLTFIAALEVSSALLFLTPYTRPAGLLLVSSFLGGAIATHMQHSQPIIQPSFVLFLIWLGTWLRHPEVLRSWSHKALGRNEPGHQEHQRSGPKGIGRTPSPPGEAAESGVETDLDRSGKMARFWKLAPWLTRLALVPPTVIFALIASRYIAHPVEAGATIGLAFHSALAVTIIRVGFGAFPLGCSIFTASCLVSERQRLTGLGFVATMIGVALAVRIFGMLADGTVRQSIGLVRAEVVLLVLVTIGAFIEFGWRRRKRQVDTPSKRHEEIMS
jgi:hypothetical protein